MNKISYLGNKELLDLPKIAFLASNAIPLDMVLKCYDWAVQMANKGKCVVSGFSSHLEKDVFHFLIKGKQPIIIVIARRMYKQVPPEWELLLKKNRLLVISVSDAVRQSKQTALKRNRYICDVADRIVFVGDMSKSSLNELQMAYNGKVESL